MNIHAIVLLLVVVAGGASNDHVPPPAAVASVARDGDAAVVTVQADSVARLGITTEAVRAAPASRSRVLGGDVVVPVATDDGATVVVEWPLAAADRLRAAESLATAEGERARAFSERTAAEAARTRARQLLQDRAGSVRGVEEAQVRLDVARAAFAAAEHRVALVKGVLGAKPAELWVRVPVYAADRAALTSALAVRVAPLGGGDGAGEPARLVVGPASANPAAATVDLFLALAAGTPFVPGERVATTFDVPEPAGAVVIPWSAVVHDAEGRTWVYEELAPGSYRRRAATLAAVHPPQAVVTDGVTPEARIVATGAAELYDIERGIGM